MSVFNIYLLFNSEGFWEKTYHPNIVGNEIIVSAAILLGLYIVVFFAFKTIALLGYKIKSAELQREIYQEQQFKSATIKDAIMIYEINITQDRMLKGFEEGQSETTIEYRRLTEDGRYIWVRAVTNLTQSMESSDLIAFVFVKDIDAEKEHQLNLQYPCDLFCQTSHCGGIG